jgi:Protein of unknown function (DUF4199)
MTRTIWKFGLLSGLLSAGMMLATIPFIDDFTSGRGEVFGYTAMVLVALLTFFGIRSYREGAGGGRLGFGRAFAIGILITLISAIFYVATWELLYFEFMPGLGDKLQACMIEKAKNSSGPPEKVAEAVRQAEGFRAMYDKPLMNVALTFAEPLPVGLVVTLLSAAILRRREGSAA